MASHCAVLSGNFSRGLVQFNGKFFHVEEFLAKARVLQSAALSAKARGARTKAVALYQALIPYLDKIDELELAHMPRGLQTQIAQRTIEQLEEPAAQSA
jgi:hypothetical protein